MTDFAVKKNVVTTIIAFAANIILLAVGYRLVILQGGVEAIGLWSTLMAWMFIIRLGDVGMANAAIRYVAMCDVKAEPQRIREYVDTSIAMNLVLFIVLAVIAYFLLYSQMPRIFPESASAQLTGYKILPLLCAGFILSNLSGLVVGALRGIHLGYIAAYITIAGTLVQLVTVIAFVPSIGLAGLAWGQVAQHAFMILAAWLLFHLHLSRDSGWSGPMLPILASVRALKEMLSFSVRAQVTNLLNGFFEPISKILINHFGGLAAAGIYELGWKMVVLPRHAVVSGVQATIPSITRLMLTDRAKAEQLYRKSLRLVSVATGSVLILVLCVSPVMSIFWLQSVDYTLSLYVLILGLGWFFNAVGAPAYILGAATGVFRANIISSGLSLLLLGILGSVSGIVFGSAGVVAVVAFSLAASGLYIKNANERLLTPT